MLSIHLDTDIGADADDLCALVYLLARNDVRLTGITTTLEQNGRRAAYVKYVLELAGRPDIPLCAGGDGALAGGRSYAIPLEREALMWRRSFAGCLPDGADAVECIRRSVREGAQIVAIGPLTNIARFVQQHPAEASHMKLTLMGGTFTRPAAGYPQWGPAQDWNLMMDLDAAELVLGCVPAVLVQVAPSLKTFFLESDAALFENAHVVLQLMAEQAKAWFSIVPFLRLERERCKKLPGNLLNFHYDPLTCAVAAGFSHVTQKTVPLRLERIIDGGKKSYRFVRDQKGVSLQLITDVDGDEFRRHFLETVCSFGT